MEVAILYVGIGKYRVFWNEFYISCEKYFLPNCKKKYYIFTDEFFYDGTNDDVKEYYNADNGWPYNVLCRYEMFARASDDFKDSDYTFFFNGNTLFKDYIHENEFLPTKEENYLIGLTWHVYRDCDNSKFPYDRNEKSRAFIPYGVGTRYYQSGITGGRTKEYIELINHCAPEVKFDMLNEIIALVHDESYLNKYFLDKNVKILDNEYGRPEEWKIPKKPKIIFRNKNKVFGKRNMNIFKEKESKFDKRLKKLTGLDKSNEIILFEGGLGNQMFQYAFYLAKLKRESNVKCDLSIINKLKHHNGYELKRIFDIDIPACKSYRRLYRWLYKLSNWGYTLPINLLSDWGVRLFLEERNSLNKVLNANEGLVLLKGYWQSELFFSNIKVQVREAFKFDENKLSKESAGYLDQIKSTKSVSIHVRRGDYMTPKHVKLYGNICTLEYYDKAIEKIETLGEDFNYYVFSDDIAWVKENINIPRAVYVDCNKGDDSWQDMFLMSSCMHNIIANSTFSWWGAWLNKNPNKVVISPSKFINKFCLEDIIPYTWIKIGV